MSRNGGYEALGGRDAVIRASVRCAGSITLILETRSHLDLPAIRDVSPLPQVPSRDDRDIPFLWLRCNTTDLCLRRRLLSFQLDRGRRSSSFLDLYFDLSA